jgi:hypothetical protein
VTYDQLKELARYGGFVRWSGGLLEYIRILQGGPRAGLVLAERPNGQCHIIQPGKPDYRCDFPYRISVGELFDFERYHRKLCNFIKYNLRQIRKAEERNKNQ